MRTVFLAITIIFVSALSFATDSMLERSEVFPPGLNGIQRYRIPGIVVTQKGTVLAYTEARKNSSSDWGEIEIHLRRSTDGGKTWEPSQHIAHLGDRIEGNPRKTEGGEHEQTVNNPVAIVDHATGAVEFLYCVNYARCFSIRSIDDGLTWSKAVEITATFEPFRKQYDWKVIATGPGHGLQLKSGRLVVPIWLAYGKVGDHKPSAAGTIYSDDHGKTWQAGDIAVPSDGEFGEPSETVVTELSTGHVMLVSRSISKPNRKLITTSPDGARGWTRPTFHAELWEPICMASIVSHPSQAGTLVFSNPHSLAFEKNGTETPAGRGKRENLSIKLSRDDGKTWPVNKTLDSGPSAYSDLGVLPDGTLLCLYESKDSIHVARFNLEWLSANDSLTWRELPSLPDPRGFAGPFAGTHNGALIVAGGANFPDKMPWEGGTKVWYDSVFMLDKPDGAWKRVGKLPRPLGYGVSLSTASGIICIGGSDANQHYSDCYRLSLEKDTLTLTTLPSLPKPCANFCGAIVGTTVYVAGGIETPTATSTLKTFWSLELDASQSTWRELEAWPGPARMLAVAAVQGNAFYLASGTDLTGDDQGKPVRAYLKDAYCYRPEVGWKRVADMPRPAVAAPTPAPVIANATFLVLSGDDGTRVDFKPPDAHPGFPKSMLAYNTTNDTWKTVGEVPLGHVTIPIVQWNGGFVMPSGEVRPGVRTPAVWLGHFVGQAF